MGAGNILPSLSLSVWLGFVPNTTGKKTLVGKMCPTVAAAAPSSNRIGGDMESACGEEQLTCAPQIGATCDMLPNTKDLFSRDLNPTQGFRGGGSKSIKWAENQKTYCR